MKNPLANYPVEWVNELIYSMIVTNYIDNKAFDYTYPWGENLASIA